MLLCSRPGKPGFVFCAFYPLFPGERVRVRGSGRTELHIAPGGIDSLRSPCGQPVRFALSLSNWLRQLSNPGRGLSFPPKAYNMRKKSPYFHASSSSNMAVRGGFEPPIRCRIHTFQACSFSHSDTSPYCHPVVVGTGANVRKSRTAVNPLFQ